MSRLREWLLKILLRKETLEQVPPKLREEVEDILEALEVKV